MALSATHSDADHRPVEPLSVHSCLNEARAYLANMGQGMAIVARDGRPVGIVTAEALSCFLPASTPISAVMDYVAVHVNPAADAEGTVRAFSGAAWDWLKQRR